MNWINLFIPEKIGSYQIFPKRIIGFDIGKTHVNATKIYVAGKKTIIEHCINEKIESHQGANYHERTIKAIQAIVKKIGSFHEVRTAIESNQIIFKELTLPFIGRDKLQLVLNFEIERLLPFPLDQAALDFIITKKDPEKNSSEILVAATQKETIESHIALFQAAGIEPSIITVDLFALYNLYSHIPEYKALKGGIILFDLGFQSTRIGFIYDGQLKRARTVPLGIAQLTKPVTEKSAITPQQALEQIITSSAQKNENQSFQKTLNEYWTQIQFTLSSFSKQLNLSNGIQKILIIGDDPELKGLPNYITEMLKIPCEVFAVKDIATNLSINLAHQMVIPYYNAVSLGTALNPEAGQSYNLLEKMLQIQKRAFLNQQIIIGASLACLLFITVFGYSFWQQRKLHTEIDASEKELIELISQELKITDKESLTDAENVIETARSQLQKEEKIWYAFSTQTRRSFLEYLQALSTAIDRQSIGLQLQKLTIDESNITMEGSVRGFDELALLEDELNQLKQFSQISIPQKTTFSITMKIKKPRGTYGRTR
ncbi:MAG: pilus assembly protein PilM [Candidatus Babeliales bacterium]